MTPRAGHLLPILLLLLAACAQPVDLELPEIEPTSPLEPETEETATPLPEPKALVVCLGQEPESLYRYSDAYLYGSTSRAAETVLQAIYDGPFNVRSYVYEPVILEKLPSIAEGDARVLQVDVSEGDRYYDPVTLQPKEMEIGDRYLPAGCNSPDCIRTFSGGTVAMDQIVAEFEIRSDVNWSDGQPVSAADSVFSFAIDQDIDTPTLKTQVDRTALYEAEGEKTVRWTGLPGYIDSEYYSNFWSPLPEHLLGELSARDLLVAPETNLKPLGWGPYILDEWRPGNDILLTRNEAYFRAAEGLPYYDTLLFRFVGTFPQLGIDQLLTSECDVLDESAIADALDIEVLDAAALGTLENLASAGSIELTGSAGAEMERLDFNTGSGSRLADPQLRAAIASCLNRSELSADLLHGFTQTPETYLPPSHPLYLQDAPPIAYDPDAAMQTLDELGWVDHDGDPQTARQADGVPGVSNGSELAITLLSTPDGLHQSVAGWIEGYLSRCGIHLETEFLAQVELFEPWPDGAAFGGEFQAVAWAWPAWVSPLCEMYVSSEIPSDDSRLGVNATRYSDPDYDAACGVLLHALPESPEYLQAAAETQQILSETLPSIPLYMRPRVVAHGADVCGIQVDPTEYSALWNLEHLLDCR